MRDLLDHSDIRHPLKVRSEADLGRKALCAHTVTHSHSGSQTISSAQQGKQKRHKRNLHIPERERDPTNAFEGIQKNKLQY